MRYCSPPTANPAPTLLTTATLRALRRLSWHALAALVVLPHAAHAFNTFSCGTGTNASPLTVQAQTFGWSTADRLIDGDQYLGWATGYNGTATATIGLGGSKTVTEVQIFVPAGQTTAQTTVVELLSSGWRQALFSTPNVTAVKLTRETGENIFEMRACANSGTGQPTISISNAQPVTEGSGSAIFDITLSATSSQTVIADFETSDNGSAVAGQDYTAKLTTVTIPPSQLTAVVTVDVIDDSDIESTETFDVTLSNPVNATLGSGAGVGTIEDDDDPPSGGCDLVPVDGTMSVPIWADPSTWFDLTDTPSATAALRPSITGLEVTVTSNGTVGNVIHILENSNPTPIASANTDSTTVVEGDDPLAVFDVTLSAPPNAQVTVDFDTSSNGTAAPGSDYLDTNLQVVLAANQTTQTVSVPILDDGASEPTETFDVALSNPSSNATLGISKSPTFDGWRSAILPLASYRRSMTSASPAIGCRKSIRAPTRLTR